MVIVFFSSRSARSYLSRRVQLSRFMIQGKTIKLNPLFPLQQVILVEREVLGPRDLQGLKEEKDQKDRGCQVWVTTAGDEQIALEMPL